MKFSWRARRRSQATRLVTIRVNWPAVGWARVGAAVWLCPHERAPLTWLVVALGVVALERGAIIRRQVSRSA